MNLTYQLIPGGYLVLRDGEPWVHQDYDQSLPDFVPMTPAAAAAEAEAFIAAKNAELAASSPEA